MPGVAWGEDGWARDRRRKRVGRRLRGAWCMGRSPRGSVAGSAPDGGAAGEEAREMRQIRRGVSGGVEAVRGEALRVLLAGGSAWRWRRSGRRVMARPDAGWVDAARAGSGSWGLQQACGRRGAESSLAGIVMPACVIGPVVMASQELCAVLAGGMARACRQKAGRARTRTMQSRAATSWRGRLMDGVRSGAAGGICLPGQVLRPTVSIDAAGAGACSSG